MKVELFKKIIKEAVREVLREENFSMKNNIEKYGEEANIATTSNNLSTSPTTGNLTSIQEILNNTRKELSRQDYKNLINDNVDDSMVPISSFVNETSVGIDLSNLSFVNKGSQIFNKTVELGKTR